MDGYVSGTYIISFMNFAGIPLATTAVLLLVGRIGDAVGIIISGPLANLLRRRGVALIAMALTTALSWPFVLAILSGRVVIIAVVQFFITFLGVGVLHGLAPILTSESFPTKFRYSGGGIAFNLSAIFGGMIAPSLLAALIGTDVARRWYYVPVVYAIYSAVGMLALVFVRETRHVDFEKLDDRT
jgi:MFS family permease